MFVAMEKVILFLQLLVISALAENCSYNFEGYTYCRSSLVTIKGLPTNLAYNPNTKDLFFTLLDLETLHNDEVQTKMDQYVLRNGEPIKIDNINGQSAAVDVPNNQVFIATDDGLAVLNSTDKAVFHSMKDEDIVQLFKPTKKDVLYASLFPENNLYKIDLKTNEKTKIDNVICAYFMAVDEQENIYYECNSKYVKVLLKGFEEPIEYVGIAKNSGRAITIDNNNRAILANNDGLYHLKPDNMIPSKLMDLDITPSGIVFDGDTIYISTNGVIFKFSCLDCVSEK